MEYFCIPRGSTHKFNDGGPTEVHILYPKKSLLFLAYPKNPLVLFSRPKKIPDVFHRPQKITFGRNFRPKTITRTPSPPPPLHALVTNRLDYSNSIMYVLPQRQISKLQRLQNATARLALDLGKFCHITPALRQLHWMPVVKRFQFKILLLTFKSIHGLSPPYISELINVKSESSYSLRSNNNTVLQYPQQKILATHGARSFALLPCISGTARYYQKRCFAE